MKSLIKIAVFLLFFSFLCAIYGSPGLTYENEGQGQPDAASHSDRPGFNLLAWLVSIYRDHISPVDGDRCPSVPSCSSYSVKAIRKHGFFIGWMMTVDRLIHEGREESNTSPLLISDGKWKLYDPVENNDFWWFPRDRKRHE